MCVCCELCGKEVEMASYVFGRCQYSIDVSSASIVGVGGGGVGAKEGPWI